MSRARRRGAKMAITCAGDPGGTVVVPGP